RAGARIVRVLRVALSLDCEATAADTCPGQRGGEGYGLHTRHARESLLQTLEELALLQRVGVGAREADARRENVRRREPGVDLAEPGHALDHQPRRHQQATRERDLEDHERSTQAPDAQAGCTARLVLQDLVDVRARRLEGRENT